MSNLIRRGYCRTCKTHVKIERPRPNHVLHLLLTICTFGAWALIWISLGGKIGGWHCTECGSDKDKIAENYTTIMSVVSLIIFILAIYIVNFLFNGCSPVQAEEIQDVCSIRYANDEEKESRCVTEQFLAKLTMMSRASKYKKLMGMSYWTAPVVKKCLRFQGVTDVKKMPVTFDNVLCLKCINTLDELK